MSSISRPRHHIGEKELFATDLESPGLSEVVHDLHESCHFIDENNRDKIGSDSYWLVGMMIIKRAHLE